MKRRRTILIVGCTGCGKGALARELARRTGGEIVSLDSMKVYRRMDIGTGKPSPEIRRKIAHHVIDVAEPSEEFSVAKYVACASQAMADIEQRGRPVFVVGGTLLYLKALTEGLFEGPGADPTLRARLHERAHRDGSAALHETLQQVDPKAAGRIHVNDLKRIVRALEVFDLTGKPISEWQAQWDQPGSGSAQDHFTMIGLRRSREDQNHRTNSRVHRMIEAGLVDETRSLLAESQPLSQSARKALGYAEVIDYLAERLTLEEAIERIKIHTRQLAKTQRTWLKRFHQIEWVDLSPDATAEALADDLMTHRASVWSV